jgi:hypothetical protein
MVCPKCKSKDVEISMVEVSSKTKKHGNGLGGKLNNMARATAAIGTAGLSNLVWKKSKGGESTIVKNQKTCICQNCGYSWALKK